MFIFVRFANISIFVILLFKVHLTHFPLINRFGFDPSCYQIKDIVAKCSRNCRDYRMVVLVGVFEEIETFVLVFSSNFTKIKKFPNKLLFFKNFFIWLLFGINLFYKIRQLKTTRCCCWLKICLIEVTNNECETHLD